MAKVSEVFVGKRYGRLVVQKLYRQVGRRGVNNLMADCLCDCGGTWKGEVERLGNITNSCGCLHIDKISTHGLSSRNKRLFHIWYDIIKRCTKPRCGAYKNYGAIGIKICKEWSEDPTAFEKWALSSGYADDLTIERINVKGDYEPGNCKWIPLSEQCQNRRDSRTYEAWGETKTVNNWLKDARCVVKNRRLIRQRVFGNKWPVEKAMTVLPK